MRGKASGGIRWHPGAPLVAIYPASKFVGPKYVRDCTCGRLASMSWVSCSSAKLVVVPGSSGCYTLDVFAETLVWPERIVCCGHVVPSWKLR